jgi:GNAT superfamily N-acetyltransferase
MSSRITPALIRTGFAKTAPQRGFFQNAFKKTLPVKTTPSDIATGRNILPYQQRSFFNRQLSNIFLPSQYIKNDNLITKSTCGNAKKDDRFRTILGLAGTATGAYLLTDNDKKVLAEEAIPLEELKQRYGITYEINNTLSEDHKSIALSKNNEPIGRINFHSRYRYISNTTSCHITYLWVDKDFRHKGLGSALLSAAINNLETSGCTEISLRMLPFDTERTYDERHAAFDILKKYYQRFGFKEITPGSDEMKRTSSPSHTSKKLNT